MNDNFENSTGSGAFFFRSLEAKKTVRLEIIRCTVQITHSPVLREENAGKKNTENHINRSY